MNSSETSVNPPGFTGEGGANSSICWNDWFHFDEAQQKCIFRSTSNVAQASAIASVLQNVKEAHA